MKRGKIVYPLFFVILIMMMVIPSVKQAHASIFFIQKATQNGANTTSQTVGPLSITLNDAIVINVFQIGSPRTFTVTDILGNTFTLRISSTTSSGSGPDTFIFTALSKATGSDTVTVGASSSVAYAISFLDYSGVTSFGQISSSQNDNAGTSGTTSLSFSGVQVSSWIVEATYFESGGASGSLNTNNGQNQRDSMIGAICNANGVGFCNSYDSIAPSSSFSVAEAFTSNTCLAPGCLVSHSGLELITTVQPTTGSFTQCIGNCGSPAVTLVNTNSTQVAFNFNQTITIFYEAQSSVNGFILNETVSVAKSYTNGQQVSLALYTATCATGVTPFTATCPGQQRALATSQPSVSKGRFTLAPNPIAINSGMWIALAFTASFSPIAINDTNTVVPMFFQAFATNPPTLFGQPLSASSCSCKMGMWAWITGNTISPLPPISPTTNCGTDLLCTLNLAIIGLTPTNPPVGAFILGVIWSVITIGGLEYFFWYITRNSEGEGQLAVLPAGLYILIFMAWTTMMMLVVGAFWYILLEALTVILLFSGYVGSLVSSRGRGRNTE